MNEVVSALRKDIDQLLNLYDKQNSLRFSDFLKIWNSINFSLIFCGKSAKILEEFTDNAFQILIDRLVQEKSIQFRIGSLYCLYSFYVSQPSNPRVKIRLPIDNLKAIKILIEELKNCKHCDALYVITYLQNKFAFQITYFLTKFDYWSFSPYGTDSLESETTEQVIHQRLDEYTRDFITSDSKIQKFISIEKEYEEMKNTIQQLSEIDSKNLFKDETVLSEQLKLFTDSFVGEISKVTNNEDNDEIDYEDEYFLTMDNLFDTID